MPAHRLRLRKRSDAARRTATFAVRHRTPTGSAAASPVPLSQGRAVMLSRPLQLEHASRRTLRVATCRSICFAAFALVAIAGSRAARAQIGRRPEWIDVDVEPVAVRRLTLAGEAIRARRWDEATRLLRQVIRENGDGLIPIDEGRLINVRMYASWVIAQLPPEGLAAYRRTAEPLARQALQEASSAGDFDALRTIVRTLWGTRAAAQAADRLARRDWGQGTLLSPLELWLALGGDDWYTAVHALPRPNASATLRQSPPRVGDAGDANAADEPRGGGTRRPPNGPTPPKMTRFRWLLAPPDLRRSASAGRRLALTLQAMGDFHAAGRCAERLLHGNDAAQTTFAERWNAAQSWPPARRSRFGAGTFGQTPARNAWYPEVGVIGPVLWRQPLWLDAQTLPFVSGGTPALPHLRPACFPITWRDAVIVGDALNVRAFRIRDGRPVFGDREGADGRVYPEVPREALIRARNRLTGFPAFTFHVSEGRVFARLGAPVTIRAEHEFDLPTAWIGLDFERGEGKLVWYLADETLGEPATSWALEGTPLVHDGRLWGVFRQSQPNSRLLAGCWDLQTHRLVWRRSVVGSTTNVEPTQNVMSHLLLSLAAGRLFLRSDYGVVAALDAQDGTPLWITATDGPPARRPPTTPGFVDRRRPYRLGERDPLPAVVHCQRVFVVGRERDTVAALSAIDGTLLWKRSLPDSIGHVLGAVRDVVVVSGRGLWALDVRTGRVLWRYRPTDPRSYGHGRGAICGAEVLWPTHDELMGFDLRHGRLLRRVSLRLRQTSGGHLLPCDGVLLLCNEDELVGLQVLDHRQTRIGRP
ncbi:MAG: hypothetical protein D6725_13810 [Planctomycetota bacterium]|nr:MAG: hypothetical protein D6725_13810 [Planctomycetota bacterium]